MAFKKQIDNNDLEKLIIEAYETSVNVTDAEKYAAKFLSAQLSMSDELKTADLSARMRKTGVKTLKAAVRLSEVAKHDKKPTEGALEDAVNVSSEVGKEQDALDETEADRDELERRYNIYREAHIFFRGIAKGRFE